MCMQIGTSLHPVYLSSFFVKLHLFFILLDHLCVCLCHMKKKNSSKKWLSFVKCVEVCLCVSDNAR